MKRDPRCLLAQGASLAFHRRVPADRQQARAHWCPLTLAWHRARAGQAQAQAGRAHLIQQGLVKGCLTGIEVGPALLAGPPELGPHMVGTVSQVARVQPCRPAAQQEAVDPLPTPARKSAGQASPCLHGARTNTGHAQCQQTRAGAGTRTCPCASPAAWRLCCSAGTCGHTHESMRS